MMVTKLHFLCFMTLTFIMTSCHASINSHTSNLGYRSSSKDVLDSGVCFQEAHCQPVQNATCFGTALPYTFTSIALAEDSQSQFEVQDNLALWQGLRSVPRCWAVVQPLLCAVYMPKCENGSVSLPSLEMCRITRGPCKSVEINHGWPSFLRCENKNLFPSRCKNPLQEIKFNTSSKCISPLAETDDAENWFHEVKGCGIQCQNPFFTKEEHDDTHLLIEVLTSLSFGLSAFAVLTFIISWKSASNYPGVIVFFITGCLAIAYCGWLIQLFPGAREEIVCRNDGTIRHKQPRVGEHLCSITFVLTYGFLMAAVCWFVCLCYAWHVYFRETASPKDAVKKKSSLFHMISWSTPVILTTVITTMKGVDANSMSGICFVGDANIDAILIFLVVPIGVASLIASGFLISVLYTLIKVKLNSEESSNKRSRKKLCHMILRMGIFLAGTILLFVISAGCFAYYFINETDWEDSLYAYTVCQAMYSGQPYSNIDESPTTKCSLKSKPSIGVLRIQLICHFAFGIMMSSWVWTSSTVEAWKKFFFRLCAPKDKNAQTLKKHQLIAKAFQRRHQINQGHLSFSLNSTHDDPVGMNFDMNSVTSRDISSSWAMALPQFIMRRNAVAGITPFIPRQYSSASDISHHISVDSYNQPNLDSLSMQISEQEYVAHALRHQRRKTRKERERFVRANRIAPWFPGNRRGSDTSLQSSLKAASIVAAAAKSMGAKVTKSTSTGDLGAQASVSAAAIMPAFILPPQSSSRNAIQRETINPPFTHGMTDNSHRFDGRNLGSSFGSSATVSQRYTPNSVAPNFQNPLGGMIRPTIYGQGYDLMSSIPFAYMGGGMFPTMNGVYPGFSSAVDFNYVPYGPMQYASFGPYQNADVMYQYQHNLIPMNPRVDSASETEFLPIIMSDSEYTDTGQRSYDEAQLLTARLMQQERMQAQMLAAAASELPQSQAPKPALEPQACAKTMFLKRMDTFNAKNKVADAPVVRPASGKKSPHSEAPPPSPADSLKSLEIGDDDVFEELPLDKEKEPSVASLPQALEEEGVFKKLKSKFKRATSLSKNCQVQPEAVELNTKNCFSSLGHLSVRNSSSPPKKVLKEKCLDAAESESLMNVKDGNENVSR